MSGSCEYLIFKTMLKRRTNQTYSQQVHFINPQDKTELMEKLKGPVFLKMLKKF